MNLNPSSTAPLPAADHAVSEVVRRWPQAARVFLRRRMACVGCAVAPYVTIAEAARSYGVSANALVAELQACVTQPTEKGGE